MTLEEIKKTAVPACREFQVKRLDLFGSLARGEGTSQSDIDLLVEFEEPVLKPSKQFFGLLHYLEDALECEIDLLTSGGLRNRYFRRRVLKERSTFMVDDILNYLYDTREAAAAISRFLSGKTFNDDQHDELLRSDVERKFEIIGEALIQIRRIEPVILDKI